MAQILKGAKIRNRNTGPKDAYPRLWNRQHCGISQIQEAARHHDSFRRAQRQPEQAVNRVKKKGTKLLSRIPLVDQDLFSPENPFRGTDEVHLIRCVKTVKASENKNKLKNKKQGDKNQVLPLASCHLPSCLRLLGLLLCLCFCTRCCLYCCLLLCHNL